MVARSGGGGRGGFCFYAVCHSNILRSLEGVQYALCIDRKLLVTFEAKGARNICNRGPAVVTEVLSCRETNPNTNASTSQSSYAYASLCGRRVTTESTVNCGFRICYANENEIQDAWRQSKDRCARARSYTTIMSLIQKDGVVELDR